MVDNLFLLDLPWFSMASPLFSSSHPSSQQSNPSAGGIPADGKATRNLMDLDPKWCPTPNKEPITNPLMPEPTYQKYLVISGGEGVDLFEKTTLSQRFHFFKDNGIDFARLEKLKSGDILLTSKGPVSSAKTKNHPFPFTPQLGKNSLTCFLVLPLVDLHPPHATIPSNL